VKILFHGFSDVPWTGWIKEIVDKYLALGDYNLFSVNWYLLAHSPWYNTAVKNAK